jgi:para-aminobenzoate synthetase component 1
MKELRGNGYKKISLTAKNAIPEDLFSIPGTANLEWDKSKTSVSFMFSGTVMTIMNQLHRLELEDILIEEPSLEEIFLHSEALYKLWLKDRFVCFSPEIFVRIEKGKIKSFPMKGTIDATLPDAEQLLMQDTKEAAEHATIVDLIRNDLSMVSEHVEVTSYRYIDRLQTNKGPILQTSSEICGTLPEDYTAHIGDILFRLLPAGSITGAPKPKTVEIIAQAEDYRRGFYTGIMGHYADGQLDSAVMIRFIEQENGQLHFKAGGGITAKSRWESEYNEVIQKIYVPIY